MRFDNPRIRRHAMLSTISMPTFPPRTIDAAVQAPASAGAVAVEPLLPRVAMGDEAAFAACVNRYGKLVYALAHRTLRSERDVDDACQEIFFALWRSASTFDPTKASEATFVAMRSLCMSVSSSRHRPSLARSASRAPRRRDARCG